MAWILQKDKRTYIEKEKTFISHYFIKDHVLMMLIDYAYYSQHRL